jgi:adenine deaminase
MKSDLRTTSGDNKSNSLVDDLNNSKTEVQNITVNGETNNTKTTVRKETENVKQKRSVVRNKCGYKLSLTVENVDNRITKNLFKIISIITIDIVTFLYIS